MPCSAFRLRSVVTGISIPLTCKESTTCFRCQLFHAIVAGFAVQRCPCWEDLGGGEEGLQKGDFGFDWVKTRYIIQGCAESSELPEAVAGEESAKTFGLTWY